MPVITASKDDGIGITGDWMRQSISQAKPASHRLAWAGGQEWIWERNFPQTATLGGRCDGAPNTIRTCGLSLRSFTVWPYVGLYETKRNPIEAIQDKAFSG